MIIYISGAISGMPNNNKRAFQSAYTEIAVLKKYPKLQGMKIINPLHLAARLNRSFAAYKKTVPEWTDYMRADIKKLADANCVYFLKDWTQSEGATMERYIAKRLNIPCADSMDELKKILGVDYGN
jgi:hypothetical protein